MKLIRFGTPGAESTGLLVDGRIYDITGFLAGNELYERGIWDDGFFARLGEIHSSQCFLGCASTPLEEARLLAPVPRPSKIICLGLNYADHALEQGKSPPDKPLLFCKAPSAIAGPRSEIIKPRATEQLDYEVELAVVIGRTTKDVDTESARDRIAGFMVMNDVTARDIQKSEKQWFRGKSFDTFAPSGPWLTSPAELGDTPELRLTLRVNGEMRQESSTAKMIFDVPFLVSYISRCMTLLPGDIISTGTPPGVGVFRKPPVFLSPGDIVESEIEHLGTLRNKVVEPAAS